MVARRGPSHAKPDPVLREWIEKQVRARMRYSTLSQELPGKLVLERIKRHRAFAGKKGILFRAREKRLALALKEWAEARTENDKRTAREKWNSLEGDRLFGYSVLNKNPGPQMLGLRTWLNEIPPTSPFYDRIHLFVQRRGNHYTALGLPANWQAVFILMDLRVQGWMDTGEGE